MSRFGDNLASYVLIVYIVCADTIKTYGLFIFKIKNDAVAVRDRKRPETIELTREFVCLEASIKGVLPEYDFFLFRFFLNVVRKLLILACKSW